MASLLLRHGIVGVQAELSFTMPWTWINVITPPPVRPPKLQNLRDTSVENNRSEGQGRLLLIGRRARDTNGRQRLGTGPLDRRSLPRTRYRSPPRRRAHANPSRGTRRVLSRPRRRSDVPIHENDTSGRPSPENDACAEHGACGSSGSPVWFVVRTLRQSRVGNHPAVGGPRFGGGAHVGMQGKGGNGRGGEAEPIVHERQRLFVDISLNEQRVVEQQHLQRECLYVRARH